MTMTDKIKIDELRTHIQALSQLVEQAATDDSGNGSIALTERGIPLAQAIGSALQAIEQEHIKTLWDRIEQIRQKQQEYLRQTKTDAEATARLKAHYEELIDELEADDEEEEPEEVITCQPQKTEDKPEKSVSEPEKTGNEPQKTGNEPEKSANEPQRPVEAEKPAPTVTRTLPDLRKAFSLNDRFRFQRELFGGDVERMNRTIDELNAAGSYAEAIAYINNVCKWNLDEEAAADFLKLVEKHFA